MQPSSSQSSRLLFVGCERVCVVWRWSGACACGRPTDYVRAAVVASSRSQSVQRRPHISKHVVCRRQLSHRPSVRQIACHSPRSRRPPKPPTTHKHSPTDRHPRRTTRALSLAVRRPCRRHLPLRHRRHSFVFRRRANLERTAENRAESLSVAGRTPQRSAVAVPSILLPRNNCLKTP